MNFLVLSRYHKKWAMILSCSIIIMGVMIPSFSTAKEDKSLSYFTVQFYRLKLNDNITVQEITKKHHFFVVSGKSSDATALFSLSRNLLQSKLMKPFGIIDSLVKNEGGRFKLYLKTKNNRIDKNKPFIFIEKKNVEDFLNDHTLTGDCHPNNRRIILFGDQKKVTKCEGNKWKVKLNPFSNDYHHIFAQISNTQGDVYFDGISLVKTKK